MLLEKDRPAHLRTAEISGKVRHQKGLTGFQEIGGTTMHGSVPNGIWNWRMARSVDAIPMQENGRWMGFMIREGAAEQRSDEAM